MKKIITIKNAPAPVGPYSQAIKHGDTLYSSGQIAIDPLTNELVLNSIDEETHQVMKNIAAILEAAQMNWNHVIKCSIFLSDMNNFKIINDIYSSYFKQSYPVRETVEVACLPKNVNVEISFIAIDD